MIPTKRTAAYLAASAAVALGVTGGGYALASHGDHGADLSEGQARPVATASAGTNGPVNGVGEGATEAPSVSASAPVTTPPPTTAGRTAAPAPTTAATQAAAEAVPTQAPTAVSTQDLEREALLNSAPKAGQKVQVGSGDGATSVIAATGTGYVDLAGVLDTGSDAKRTTVYVSAVCDSVVTWSGQWNQVGTDPTTHRVPYSGKDCYVIAAVGTPKGDDKTDSASVTFTAGTPTSVSKVVDAGWDSALAGRTGVTLDAPASGTLLLRVSACSGALDELDDTTPATGLCGTSVQLGVDTTFTVTSGGRTTTFTLTADEHADVYRIDGVSGSVRVATTSGPPVVVHGPGSVILEK